MMRAFALMLALAMSARVVHAATHHRDETGLGFVAGPIGGLGFAFRTFDESGFGWQVGGLASSNRWQTTVFLGGQLMHTIEVRQRSRLYALAGAMHVFESRDDDSTNVGAGIGMSFGGSHGVTAAIELPLVVHFRRGYDGIAPIPQVSLVYNY